MKRAHAGEPSEIEIKRELARELHDEVAQSLNVMLLELHRFKTTQSGRAGVVEEVAQLEQSMRDVLTSLRAVLFGLRGEDLASGGSVFGDVVRVAKAATDAAPIKVDLNLDPEFPAVMPAEVSLQIVRILQEATSNAVRHAYCSELRIDLGVQGDALRAVVADNGRGMPLGSLDLPGVGLEVMRERAAAIRGEVRVQSEIGVGTTVTVTVPLSSVTPRPPLPD